ncbi:hypothetical protein D5018_19060 [Parashewanella curva]|uniref:Uncharacterized protein n=1 Tax=Parashewanella curva TaxID=2338552 RepID=A0A3L8PRR0_9GAMM|nr:hypothetical protein [Parashewanella curva]RLV58097.1 hypothetical protein D5018_19060 [Parashewanella curva]
MAEVQTVSTSISSTFNTACDYLALEKTNYETFFNGVYYEVFKNKETRIIQDFLLTSGDLIILPSIKEPQFLPQREYDAIFSALYSLTTSELRAVDRHLYELTYHLICMGYQVFTDDELSWLQTEAPIGSRVNFVFNKVLQNVSESSQGAYLTILDFFQNNQELGDICSKMHEQYAITFSSQDGYFVYVLRDTYEVGEFPQFINPHLN